MSAKATVITASAPSSTRFGPTRSESAPPRKPLASAAADWTAAAQAGEPERDPAHVVEVDEQERQHDAVPERVDERSELEHVDGPRQSRIEASGGRSALAARLAAGERGHWSRLGQRVAPSKALAHFRG